MALDLFKMPRNLGDYEEKEVVIGIGRFGPFVRHNSMFVSIPKTDDPYTIDIDRAIELIEAKRKSDSEKTIKLFDENPEVKVLKGRWGPYIVFGKKNIKIPKDLEPEKITYADCVRLEKDTPDAPKGRFGRFAKKNTDTKAAPAKTAPKKLSLIHISEPTRPY